MLYISPTKRHLGVEILGAEEEHLDLYDALLELIECADGIDSEGAVRYTHANSHLIDFLDLVRQAGPVPQDYLDDVVSPAGAKPGPKGDDAGNDRAPGDRPKVLAFPGVDLGGTQRSPEEDEEDDEGEDDVTIPDLGDIPEDVLAALEEFRARVGAGVDGDENIEGRVLDDDLMVGLMWPEAIHVALRLNDYLGWSATTRDQDWSREIRWRPAYGTVLRFQAQLIDCICGALPARQADQARALFTDPKTSVRDFCLQYMDILSEEFVMANSRSRKAMLAPTIAEIAKPGPRNAEIQRKADAEAKKQGCDVDQISFVGEMPEGLEW